MTKELIVQLKSSRADIALLENSQLVELHQEKTNNKISVGDIFLGKITRVTPGLNATFVNIGYRKEGFLHYSDLGPQIQSHRKFLGQNLAGKEEHYLLGDFEHESDIPKNGKINEVLQRSQCILVQVTKEPISTKGPRLTSEITLAGRYIVLVPFSNQVSISRRIRQNEERERLTQTVENIRPAHFGVIVRTAAENQSEKEIQQDINGLLAKWAEITQKLPTAQPPQKLLSELNKSFSILRDLVSDSFNKVVINDPDIAKQIQSYLKVIAPEQKDIVEVYKGKISIFDQYKVTKQIKSLFGKTVNLPNGAYVVIEHTEAMSVIDVNSGHKVNAEANQEKNALGVNLAAADEIARQLRLRDIGGIIIIDFIDMRESENRKLLLQQMKTAMTIDRAKHTILPITKFGLMQITRQRVRPILDIQTTETCPTCEGSGQIGSTLLLIDEMEVNLSYLFEELNYSRLKLVVHPFIEAFLRKGWVNQHMRWMIKYRKWLDIKPDSSHHLTEFKFFGGDDNSEIQL